MPDTKFVVMEKLGRTYEQGSRLVRAVDGVSASIRSGDRIAIVGPSGSGKTTLLHLIGGIDEPSEGGISWPALGERETLRPGRVAYVFQTSSLLEALTVVENVELPLLLSGQSQREARERAVAALAGAGLANLAERLSEELSGGQAQQVAIARAIASGAKLVLADEPTGQLDHPTAQRLMDKLLGALAGSDAALVLTTHDQSIASRMSVIWKIEHGRMEEKS
jgi:putative ABC transport system ATP-binding protein/lipoprotein-releasing system ATP-binding protein